MKLAPYPEYKESGQPFLGEIPAHWDLFRNGRLFSQRNETGFGELPILEVSLKTGVRVRDMDNLKRKQVMSDREKYKRAAQGDIAYNMMRMWQGAVGVAPVDGLVSPAYVVVRPFPEVDCRYFSYLFRTASYMNEVDAYSRGIVKDRNRLYWQDFKRMPSPVPSVEEQRHITRFLDAVGSKAQRFIRNKRRLIELLKEQKQNVINQAVTRGLDPNVKLKPSGVEWIGDIPEHWNMVPLKHLASFKGGTGFPHEAQGRSGLELPFYKVSDMTLSGNETYMINTNNSISRETASSLGATIFPERAIIFPKVGGAMLTNKRRILTKPSCIDNNMMGCVLNSETIFDFLFLRLQTLDLGLIRKPGPVPAIGEGEVRAFRVPCPPEEEQLEIVEYVKVQTSAIDQAISRAQREIELMREYRTRLISDVVTGQVDVRGIEVPEVAEEELLEPDEDTSESDDVIDDEMDMEVEE